MTAAAKSIRRRGAVDAAALARRFPSLHPVLARVYAGRNVRDESELDYSLSRMPKPDSLRDIDAAADILADAVEAQAAITIVGDYDVDGATSTALMKLALEAFGAAEVRYFVPDRFTLGYGLSEAVAEAVAVKFQPDVLVTVDNGISSHAGVDRAHEHGITVIVTDHHLPGDGLPRADAVVNPNRADDGFPDKTLAGVGVAFYVLLALRARLRERGWFGNGRAEPNLADHLDLVALGTIADMVPLQYLNRILVRSGMARICAGRCRPGIRALLKVSKLQAEKVTARDIGFRVAPRLNAAGRLAEMNIGVDCLLIDDEKTVNEIAARLDELNRERRNTQEQMQTQAEEIIGELDIAKNGDIPAALCLYDPRWHQGVIGLVASRLKDAHGCPCVVFADGGEDGALKGSARSIRGVHMRDLFAGIAARRPDLIVNFGGHAMAAGLGIRAEDFTEFAAAFTESASAECHAAARAENRAVDSDGALGEGDLCLGVARQLAAGGPWGQNFPEPLFDNEFEVRAAECVGAESHHLKLQLALPGGAQTLEAIAFSHLKDGDAAPVYEKVRAAYRLGVNTWREEKVQLVIEHLQPL